MSRRLLKIIVSLAVLVILVVLGPPLVSKAIDQVRDWSKEVPLTPTGVRASSEGRSTAATRIADGANNRYWAPTGPAEGAWVELSFTDPVRVLHILVTPGISIQQERFLTAGRPAELSVTAFSGSGEVGHTVLRLRDQPGAQRFRFKAAGVVRLRLVVVATYGPTTEPAVAIGEVELFGRR